MVNKTGMMDSKQRWEAIRRLRQRVVTMTVFPAHERTMYTYCYRLGRLCTSLELMKHVGGFFQHHGNGLYTNEFAQCEGMARNPSYPQLAGPVVVFSGQVEDEQLAVWEDEMSDDEMSEDEMSEGEMSEDEMSEDQMSEDQLSEDDRRVEEERVVSLQRGVVAQG